MSNTYHIMYCNFQSAHYILTNVSILCVVAHKVCLSNTAGKTLNVTAIINHSLFCSSYAILKAKIIIIIIINSPNKNKELNKELSKEKKKFFGERNLLKPLSAHSKDHVSYHTVFLLLWSISESS